MIIARTDLDASLTPHVVGECRQCGAFGYEQLVPGRFTVCRRCRGSQMESAPANREPGEVVRNSSGAEAPNQEAA